MHPIRLALGGLAALSLCLAAAGLRPRSAPPAAPLPARAPSFSLPFVENRGQVAHPEVAFYVQTFAGTAAVLRDRTLALALSRPGARPSVLSERVLDLSEGVVIGASASPTRMSVFCGSPESWRTNLPTFDSVSLGRTVHGVEVSLHATARNVERRFRVPPGADPSSVAVQVVGARELVVEPSGELRLETTEGPVRLTRPVAFQELEGERRPVEVAYAVTGDHYGFAVGQYDRSAPLVIDPLLASTYLGGTGTGSASDTLDGLVVDPSGDVFVTGSALPPDFPVSTGAWDSSVAEEDAFVTRLSPDLKTVVASTVLGGARHETGRRLVLANGSVYVAGYTYSSDFPTTASALRRTACNSGTDADGFVTKLDPLLGTLQASTYLCGNATDSFQALAATASGVLALTGFTRSTDFPTTAGAFRTAPRGLSEIFVTKLDADLQSLVASTYLSTSAEEAATSLVTLGEEVLIGGRTSYRSTSTNLEFPLTPGSFKQTGSGAFVTRFDTGLSQVLTSTLLGSSYLDVVTGLAADASHVWLAMETEQGDFPVSADAAFRTLPSQPAAVIARFDSALTTVQRATYVPAVSTMALGPAQEVYFAGVTRRWHQTPPGAFTTEPPGDLDLLIGRLAPDLGQLTALTYLGGAGQDEVSALAITGGGLFVAGTTGSSDLPMVTGAFQPALRGQGDAFVVRLDAQLSAALQATPATPDFGTVAVGSSKSLTLTLGNTSTAPVTVGTLALAGALPGEFSLSADGCSATSLSPGASCTATVGFAPTAPWRKDAWLRVPSPAGPAVLVPLVGHGQGTANGLAESTWPTHRGNLRHTGRTPLTGPRKPVQAWTLPLDGPPGLSVLGGDGTIYVTTGPQKATVFSLWAVNPDGTEKWHVPLVGPPGNTAPVVARDGSVFVHVNGGTGIADVEKLQAFGPTGLSRWVFEVNGGSAVYTTGFQPPPILAPDGTVVFGGGDTRVWALDQQGNPLWYTSLTGSSQTSAPALDAAGMLRVHEPFGLFTLTPTGQRRQEHRQNVATADNSSVAIGDDGTAYYVHIAAEAVFAVGPDGLERWRFTSPKRPANGSPALAADGTLYFGVLGPTGPFGLIALDPQGQQKWRSEACYKFSNPSIGYHEDPSPLVDGRGTVYCSGTQGLAAIDPDGVHRWWADGYHPLLAAENLLVVTQGNSLVAYTEGATAQGTACSSDWDCVGLHCSDGVCCNEACGQGDPGDCRACSVKAGAAEDGVCGPVAAQTVCRAAVGKCDVAERCDGTALTCPSDALAVAGTECRAAAGLCDVPESCTGDSVTCPENGYQPEGLECRPSRGTCDVAEVCSGKGPGCPVDQVQPRTTVCRAVAGPCDREEQCDGVVFLCPEDRFQTMGTECRAADGACDAPEVCSGNAAACPEDVPASIGTLCRDAAGSCDRAERCTGQEKTCPPDELEPAGVVCRAAAGACDEAEECSGMDPACPIDALRPEGDVCETDGICEAGTCVHAGPDAGLSGPDAAEPLADAGTPGADAGTPKVEDSGCGCSTTPGPLPGAVMVWAIALWPKRRRKGFGCQV